jgi:L,D-peptidoglycan transpeptidase YkuD (ErfK/YbiS/YcfS/YnhG family)
MNEQQRIVVLTPKWDSTVGYMHCLEKVDNRWVLAKKPIPVSVGKNGMAWGLGLHEPTANGPIKQEGDMRAPAGIFSLSTVFGDSPVEIAFPYLLVDDELECVDDPSSKYYNQFVKGSQKDKDWNSSEKMLMPDGIYSRGIVVEHNTHPPIPGKGSCIFIHKWRAKDGPTAGCTALSEENLHALIEWLDIKKNPLLIQVPLEAKFFSNFETDSLPLRK